MLKIITVPNKILRQKTEMITFPLTQEMVKLVPEMCKAMMIHDGIGLAAPQVGFSIKLIVINTSQGPRVFFNPQLLNKSWRKVKIEEGCLSVPGVFGIVKRPNSVTAHYQDEFGKTITERLTGLLARVYQHEVDHLNGILFTDKVSKITSGQDLLSQYGKF